MNMKKIINNIKIKLMNDDISYLKGLSIDELKIKKLFRERNINFKFIDIMIYLESLQKLRDLEIFIDSSLKNIYFMETKKFIKKSITLMNKNDIVLVKNKIQEDINNKYDLLLIEEINLIIIFNEKDNLSKILKNNNNNFEINKGKNRL